MRIKSSFKDYYDGLQSLSTDPDTVFIRKNTTEEDRDRRSEYTEHAFSNCIVNVIGFCGKLYPYFYNPKENTISYDVEDYRRACKEIVSKKRKYRGWYSGGTQKSLIDRLLQDDHSELFEKYGPIFVIKHRCSGSPCSGYFSKEQVIISPKLSNYLFGKCIPPHEAYNELYKYIAINGRNTKPIPEMSNDVKIHQAGFDLKTSFRKEKEHS